MNKILESIRKHIDQIPFIDTHEHLLDESERLSCIKPYVPCDDWAALLSLYPIFDLVSAGMLPKDAEVFLSQDIDPFAKWDIIKPFWPLIKHTGYGQVIKYTIQELYQVTDLNDSTIDKLQAAYSSYRKKGFYLDTLKHANIKSCIVNSSVRPFKETESPYFLHQDINASGMVAMDFERYNENLVPQITCLDDWLDIISWWFNKYAAKAVGVKIGNAYFRRLDFEKTSQELAATLFFKKINEEKLSQSENKALQDFIFWYVIELATKHNLPVKFHMGHQAMNNFMNLENVMFNPSDGAKLCQESPETRFVFYHISYPNYEPLISLAKHYSNVFIDMCWAWTLNPIAAVDFLKKYIMTAPINKLMVFGGDDVMVENLIGHAKLARKGISQALASLVYEKWLTESDAIDIAERIMWNNAEKLYNLNLVSKN